MIADTTMTLIYLVLLSMLVCEQYGLKVKFKTNEKLKAPGSGTPKPPKPLLLDLAGMAGGKLAATPHTGPVRKNTLSEAVAAITESMAQSCLNSEAGHGFSMVTLNGCGQGGSARKTGRVASDTFLTPCPPDARKNADGGFLSPEGAEAMTTVNTQTTPTGTTAVSSITRRTKPVAITITKPDGLSFRTKHTDARGKAVLDNFFDVPAEDYCSGWDTGRRAAAELFAVIKAAPRNGHPMFGRRLSDLLPDVEKALADCATGNTPDRKGAALGFLSVLDAAIQFAVHNADMQAYVQREIDRSEVRRLQSIEREAAERAEFVQRMQAARKAKRAGKGVAA